MPLKRLAAISYGLGQPPLLSDDGVPIVRATNIFRGQIKPDGLIFAKLEDLPLERAPLLREGEVLVVRSGAYTGDSALVTTPWVGSAPGYDLRITPGSRADGRFIAYCLLSAHVLAALHLASSRAAQPHLNAEELGETRIDVPTLGEQRAIADYLHTETARIDALIAKKQQLIEVLDERWSALLSRTVAPNGLIGSATLDRDDLAWPTSAFGAVVSVAEGQVDPRDEPWASTVLIAPNHVESRTGRILAFETARDQGAISGKYRCRPGDVIYSKIRPALRKAAMAEGHWLCSADMYPLRSSPDLLPQFLLLLLLSEPFTEFAVLESDRVAMPKINRDALSRIRIPLPPIEVQQRLVRMLSDAMALRERTVGALGTQTALLLEHRQALITAAVTGQHPIPGVA